jgi:hypothetical protein
MHLDEERKFVEGMIFDKSLINRLESVEAER